MTYVDGKEEVNVGAATKVYYDITTNRDVTYPQMNIEAIMPLGNTTAKLSICRARMTSVGKNLPCVAPEWINTLFTYSSRWVNCYTKFLTLFRSYLCSRKIIGFLVSYICHRTHIPVLGQDYSCTDKYKKKQSWLQTVKRFQRNKNYLSIVTSPMMDHSAS